MRFSGEVDHGVMAGENRPQRGGIADVALDKLELRAVSDRTEIGQVTGIGQLVKHGDAGIPEARIATGQERTHVVRADKTRPAGYQGG